jgi:hypothetical protein
MLYTLVSSDFCCANVSCDESSLSTCTLLQKARLLDKGPTSFVGDCRTEDHIYSARIPVCAVADAADNGLQPSLLLDLRLQLPL